MYSDPTWFVGLLATEQCCFVSYTNYTDENHNVQPFFPDLTIVRPNKEMGGNLANWSVFSRWPPTAIITSANLTFVLLCAPFLSPLPHRWQYTVGTLWLLCRSWVSAELAGVLLTLIFAWNVTQSVWRAESKTKGSNMDGWVTYPLLINKQDIHFYVLNSTSLAGCRTSIHIRSDHLHMESIWFQLSFSISSETHRNKEFSWCFFKIRAGTCLVILFKRIIMTCIYQNWRQLWSSGSKLSQQITCNDALSDYSQ